MPAFDRPISDIRSRQSASTRLSGVLVSATIGVLVPGRHMRRRDFIAALGSTPAWPLAARAQRPGKVPIIGYLGAGSASTWRPWTAAFVERLSQLGWTEGRSVAFEYRWADGKTQNFARIATELVQLRVDIIVTSGAAGLAVKQATTVIPVVLAPAGDPVGGGLRAAA
jgi:putative tryptophan/tyrosine transport system substrate-binding protein